MNDGSEKVTLMFGRCFLFLLLLYLTHINQSVDDRCLDIASPERSPDAQIP
jgi:hypothetical protein